MSIAMGSAADKNQPEVGRRDLPILPLRNTVPYPRTMLPLTVHLPRSVQMMVEVAAGDREVGLVALRVAEAPDPAPQHLFPVGCRAELVHVGNCPGQRDRLELIHLEGYAEHEKLHICRKFLVPRQREANALERADIRFTDSALRQGLTFVLVDHIDEVLERVLRRSARIQPRRRARTFSRPTHVAV